MFMSKLSPYEEHQLDQCEAAVAKKLTELARLTDREFEELASSVASENGLDPEIVSEIRKMHRAGRTLHNN